MQLTLLKGYPDLIGRRQAWSGYGNGPASYVTGGDPITLPGYKTNIDSIGGGVSSVSGNYTVVPIPSSIGPRPTWKLKWLYAGNQQGVDGVAQTVAGTGMTPGTYALTFTGGGGSGAAGTVTVSATAATNITLTSYGSGYLVAPSVSAATGGTPLTLAATVGTVNGGEVSSTTNLSAEQVVIGGLGGEY